MEDHFNGVWLKPYVQRVGECESAGDVERVLVAAVEDADVYVYGELLRHPVIQTHREQVGQAFRAAEILAYGTLADAGASGVKLGAVAERKLRQLTIVSMAGRSKELPYGDLLRELNLDNVRSLEDLVIDAMYREVFKGKLDHELRRLEVKEAIGRDVAGPADIAVLTDTIRAFRSRAIHMLHATNEQGRLARHAYAANQEEARRTEERIKCATESMEAALAVTPMVEDTPFRMVGDPRATKRSKHQ